MRLRWSPISDPSGFNPLRFPFEDGDASQAAATKHGDNWPHQQLQGDLLERQVYGYQYLKPTILDK